MSAHDRLAEHVHAIERHPSVHPGYRQFMTDLRDEHTGALLAHANAEDRVDDLRRRCGDMHDALLTILEHALVLIGSPDWPEADTARHHLMAAARAYGAVAS